MSTVKRVAGDYTIQGVNTGDRVSIDYSNFSTSANLYITSAPFWKYAPAPTEKSTTATLTAKEVAAGIVSTIGTSYTVTLPTGTALDTYFTGVPTVNIGFDFSVVNTASGTVTIAAGASGMTSLGTLTVTTGMSATFCLRRTAANTYILYRL
jgi:streptogramin lyase